MVLCFGDLQEKMATSMSFSSRQNWVGLAGAGGGRGTKMASKKNLAIVRKRMCHVDAKFTQVLLIFWANED
jgi:hypothetical protein